MKRLSYAAILALLLFGSPGSNHQCGERVCRVSELSTVTAATANSEALLTGASAETLQLFSPDPLPPSTERQPVLMMPQQSVFWDVLRSGDNLNCYNGACF